MGFLSEDAWVCAAEDSPDPPAAVVPVLPEPDDEPPEHPARDSAMVAASVKDKTCLRPFFIFPSVPG